jgi:hypothetical protein
LSCVQYCVYRGSLARAAKKDAQGGVVRRLDAAKKRTEAALLLRKGPLMLVLLFRLAPKAKTSRARERRR